MIDRPKDEAKNLTETPDKINGKYKEIEYTQAACQTLYGLGKSLC